MGILAIDEIQSKINNCLNILSSDLCTDRLYIIFVACEYLKYTAALKYNVHAANRAALASVYNFGYDVLAYRNAFAHSDSIKKLLSLIDNLKNSMNAICSEFSGDIYFKVYDALN